MSASTAYVPQESRANLGVSETFVRGVRAGIGHQNTCEGLLRWDLG
jgi:hypothetical protein